MKTGLNNVPNSRPSVRKVAFGWKGVRRNIDSNAIVAECLHTHRNRDESTEMSGLSAYECGCGVTGEQLEERFIQRRAEHAKYMMRRGRF